MFVNSPKNNKIGATRCQVLRLKCTKFAFRWGSAPDPAEGAYSAPQTSGVLNGPILLRRDRGKGEGKEEGKER